MKKIANENSQLNNKSQEIMSELVISDLYKQ